MTDAERKFRQWLTGIMVGHHEWRAHVNLWDQLYDSFVGGGQYRDAIYSGRDTYGYPIRNLYRHKRERPIPRASVTDRLTEISRQWSEGKIRKSEMAGMWQEALRDDPLALAGEDDYEFRRARTPVPDILEDIVGEHVDRIYRHTIKRENRPRELQDFYRDVDGRGTAIDTFMRDHVAGPGLALSTLDLLFDHPAAPPDDPIATQAEVVRLGLDRCVVQVVLPQNVVWWLRNVDGTYRMALIREFRDVADGTGLAPYYRLWTPQWSRLFDAAGEPVDPQPRPHPFGTVPLRRIVSRPKPGHTMIGRAEYEAIAQRMREAYNVASEIVISNSQHAHPVLCMDENQLKNKQDVPWGMSWILPISSNGEKVIPPMMLDIPQGPVAALFRSMGHHTAEAYRSAGLDAPAWAEAVAADAGAPAPPESAMAREMVASKLNAYLARAAGFLADAEAAILWGFSLVRQVDTSKVKISYPVRFGVFTAETLIANTQGFQKLHAATGRLPDTEKALYGAIVRELLPGRREEDYAGLDAEATAFIDRRAEVYQQELQRQQEVIDQPNPPGDATGNGQPEKPAAVLERGNQPERRSPQSINARLTSGAT